MCYPGTRGVNDSFTISMHGVACKLSCCRNWNQIIKKLLERIKQIKILRRCKSTLHAIPTEEWKDYDTNNQQQTSWYAKTGTFLETRVRICKESVKMTYCLMPCLNSYSLALQHISLPASREGIPESTILLRLLGKILKFFRSEVSTVVLDFHKCYS